MKTITAICIGDELLDGRIRDMNAAHLGEFASLRGAVLERVVVVPDDVEAICGALEDASTDLVVVSGGLGPTADDVTREAAARFAETTLVEHEDVLESLRQRFASRNYPFTENNRRQAQFPSGARVLPTEVGSAPGFALERDGRLTLFFPGVPREFRWFCATHLSTHLDAPTDLQRRRLFFHGIGESALETRLEDVEELAVEVGGRVGYRADYPVIEVKLSAVDEPGVERLRDHVLARVGAWLVSEGDEPLPARVGRLLLEHAAVVTTAESCTAGGIAAAITDVSGSSSWFHRGYVTYSNEAKMEELGVSASILERFGAVSPQTVCQMALGAKRRARADFGIAVSGIAGPTGGTPEKPVGTVHFALAAPEGTYHRHVLYRLASRGLVRRGTIYTALAMLLWRLEDRMDAHDVSRAFGNDEVFSESGIVLEAREESS